MQCKCSLNNNYKIIGLCDIDKFNEKIKSFNDKSWTQITLSEKVTIPSNLPDANNITKLYIDIKITSTKIIITPLSSEKNIEGSTITGKMLLISGELCQKIIYIADNFSQSTHSLKCNISFNTYIVIDENTDIDSDKYCVYPCIEDVSVRVLDKRHLSKNITLFLFAHKIELPLNITNQFIFYDFNSSQDKKELVRVSFDGAEKKLIVISTGNIYNAPNEHLFISFELTDSNGTSKALGEITYRQNGTGFTNNLNNIPFEIGDLIFLYYQSFKNTILTDYPYIGDTYDMNFVGNRNFKITKDGIIPQMLPNIISLTATNNIEVLNIGFDTYLKNFLPHQPTNEVTNPTYQDQIYFKVIVKDSNMSEKYNASIQGNQYGIELLRHLINKQFEYGDIIELEYKERNRVSVTNNPYPSSTRYNLKGSSTSFRITENGLKIIEKPINKLQNALILSNSSNKEMLKIEFDISNLEVIATATDAMDNSYPNEMLFGFKMNNFDREIKFGETAKAFASALDGEPFNLSIKSLVNYKAKAIILNNLFSIIYKPEASTNIKITNFPTHGQNYTPLRNPPFEDFKIKQTGLEITTPPPIGKLPNTIIIKSKTNQEVSRIEFNKNENKFIVTSSGIVPDLTTAEAYVTLILKNNFGDDVIKVVLNSNENGNAFKTALNDKNFDYNSNNLLVLIYKDKTKIEITNYPVQGISYNPEEYSNLLEITQNGLVDKSLHSKIKIYNDDDNEVSTIQFLDIDNPTIRKMIITSTGETSTNRLEDTQVYVQFNTFIPKNFFNAIILGKQNADKFLNELNNKSVNTGLPMKLSNKIANRILITNYKNQTEYRIGEEPEFLILEDSLMPYNLNYNKIRLKNNDNSYYLFIYFIGTSTIYIFYSTGLINTDLDNFEVRLWDSSERYIKVLKSINRNETADSINTPLREMFNIGDVLELSYSDRNLVEITDIPKKGDVYNPKEDFEKFRLTLNGLQKINGPQIQKLQNAIVVIDNKGKDILVVEFDITNKKLIANATNNTETSGFGTLLDLTIGGNSYNLQIGENAKNVASKINNVNFQFGESVVVLSFNTKYIIITNYPTINKSYHPEKAYTQFILEKTGLIKTI